MSHIAGGSPPTRRIARAISMGLYQRDLVLSAAEVAELVPEVAEVAARFDYQLP